MDNDHDLLSNFFSRIFHWGPILALLIIKVIFLTTLFVTSMWLSPFRTLLGAVNHVVFLSWVAILLYNFFLAIALGPGFVPRGWRPDIVEEERFVQRCPSCNAFKAPRSHHCRRCERCVFKMDHHCPWINTCCGHRNHANFTLFLFFAVCGSIHSTILLVKGLLKAYYFSFYLETGDKENLVYLTFFPLLATVFSLGLSIGVILAVGGLCYIQIKIILYNETTIENWIVSKALMRDRPEDDIFIYPYDLGFKENIRQVFKKPLGDGIHWPVVQGCHQYTLTIEQICQKADKRLRMREYQIIKPYNGSFFALSHGFGTCCSTPISDEPRLPLKRGDVVSVTRWKKYWLYGEVERSERGKPAKKRKGWFPRAVAVDLVMSEPSSSTSSHISRTKRPESKKSI